MFDAICIEKYIYDTLFYIVLSNNKPLFNALFTIFHIPLLNFWINNLHKDKRQPSWKRWKQLKQQ